MKRRLLLVITIVLLNISCIIAAKKDGNAIAFDSSFYKLQDTLVYYNSVILQEPDDSLRWSANCKFRSTIEEILSMHNSFYFPFDGMKSLSKITSPDDKFRIICWLYPEKSGVFIYNGIIQFTENKSGNSRILALNDCGENIKYDYNTAIFRNGGWYGNIIFNIIPNKDKKQTIYTLLGWRGSMVSNEKIIDVLTFDSDNNPTFGAMIFDGFKQASSRIIFKYKHSAYMMLSSLNCKYKPTDSKSYKRGRIIAFDRLAPISDNAMNELVPASSIIDGLYYNKGRWILTLDAYITEKIKQ